MATKQIPKTTTEVVEHPDYVESSEKALLQPMSVTDSGYDDGFYTVQSISGETYTVDVQERTCECPASTYNGSICKHVMRAAIADADGLDDVRGIDLPVDDPEAY